MGLKDKIKGLLKKGSDGKNIVGYALWYNQPGKRGGRVQVCKFDHKPTAQELQSVINGFGKEGVYSLQEIVKQGGGEIFGNVIWKQKFVFEDSYEDEDDVEEVEEEKPKRRRRRTSGGGSDFMDMLEGLKAMKEQFEEMAEVGAFLARLGGKNIIELPDGKSMEELVIEQMDKLRQKYEKMRELFGDSRVSAEDAQIPVEGKIPAVAVYLPKLLDQVMDSAERRLKRWGVLGDEEDSKVEVPEFPEMK